MSCYRIIAFLIICSLPLLGLAQELPPIQNFSPFEYGAGNQNWSISQSPDKLIYAANNQGLLEYNGASWRLYPSPNETIMRSVQVLGDSIYTGCYMDFGYWKKNKLGRLEYTSLSEKLELKLIEDEEFWKIVGIEQWIIFQSLNRIYIYDSNNETVDIVDSQEDINKMFELEETIYFQKLNLGVYKIDNGKASLFIDDSRIKNDEVVNMIKQEDKIILITRNDGFYGYENGKLEKLRDFDDKLIGLSIYDAIQLSNKNIALGTISNGLIYYDLEKGIEYEINRGNGIQNNTVLSIFEDGDGNIWTGLDNGISYININAPISIYTDQKGKLGSVYASAVYDDNIYLGTNQGLFYKPLNQNIDFQFIEKTEGQVWCLTVIDATLFCGHHTGTFIVKENRAKNITNTQGTWKIEALDDENQLLIQGNYDGLNILQNSSDKGWILKHKIKGFDNSSRSFAVLDDRIFVNHEYKGVFQLIVNEDFSNASKVILNTQLKGANSSIAKFNGNVVYAYQKGILTYNTDQDKFEIDSVLSKLYREADYSSGRMIADDQADEFWIFTQDNINVIRSGNLSTIPKFNSLPLSLDLRRDVVEFENLVYIKELDQYLLGTSFGHLIIDHKNFSIKDFEVNIESLSIGINSDHSASNQLIDWSFQKDFESEENNIKIDFYTPGYYSYLKPHYQFQLIGLYDSWSEWSTESSVFFENLPPGEYSFNVKSRIGDKVSNNIANYQFAIAKPWYFSEITIAISIIMIIFTTLIVHQTYRKYYHGQQRKLIEQNKREIEFARLQNEQEIIKIKNEQLKRDFKTKSNELAASTMSMVRKNELLLQIKDQLIKAGNSDSLQPVIEIIDGSLDHDENWEFFREAFDSADSEFFKKLKNRHPDLSPNDLKLCAYLRLNLSSKEIAQLLNISPKSVEIKRYRLRKKMDLASNENLIDHILNI